MSTTNSKWLPPQQEGFGPWIELGRGDTPAIPKGCEAVRWLTPFERENERFAPATEDENWAAQPGNLDLDCVVAYCVKLDGLQAQAPEQAPDTALVGGKLTGDHYYRVAVSDPMAPDLQPYVAECADIIEALDMTFNEGEAFKALWRLAAARQGRGKPGNKPQYDADKAAHYGQRVAVCERRKAGAT